MDKDDLTSKSYNFKEKPWPENETINYFTKGICQRGRKWFNLDLDQIIMLFGDIVKDSPKAIDYFDILLTFVRKTENDVFFDVELKSYIRGFPVPNIYPSPMFKYFIHAFADVCDKRQEDNSIIRLEVHREGFFWDIPLNHVLEDEGFYEKHFT